MIPRYVLAAVVAVAVATGCAQPGSAPPQTTSPPPPAPAGSAAAPAPRLPGTYTGTLPCADCPGIDTTVTLGPDGMARVARVYREHNDGQPFTETGRWALSGERVLLTMGDGQTLFFRPGREGSTLTLLDTQGNPITGPIAPHLVLRRR